MNVLIIVDMQKGFVNFENYLTLNERINQYIKNNHYDKIFLTQFINDKSKNSLYQDKVNWNGLTTKEEQEFSLDISKDAIILKKYGYGLELADLDYIKSLGIKTIDICGLKASACVYAVSLQLFDVGIYPNILINLVEDEPKIQSIMKEIFIKQFGNVTE